ncbi:hypothetical protein Mal64_05790 [Pseudobythopirellula maris]|uniref:DUF58 domain-containing protein n=1 Tax=Pseudobythopirellula maris TaxID=2527991 RepID=A0A5C5ZT37_9BACT|nr:DUF58 domain-containing protein [Pseudobythopirellula maris]TWT90195.1 hypothetical protein Mal64_05790 [Pseudobythopirellula maris]
MAAGEMKLTDPQFIQRLESLYLLARKVLGGSLQADRKSVKKGAGVTFADYSEYYYGADFRAIDWRVFARFETLVVKLFELEEDATIYLLMDCSQSMASKFPYAKQLTAALAYIALSSLDRVAIYGLGDGLTPVLEPCRGRAKALAMLRGLEDAPLLEGDTRFNLAARQFRARHARRGLVVAISDFLFPEGFEEGLKFLGYHGHEVYALQVQDEGDTRCELRGDVDLECVETDARLRVTVSPREARLYEEAVAEWNESLRRCCVRLGVGLAATTPEAPFERVVQDILRRGGLVA